MEHAAHSITVLFLTGLSLGLLHTVVGPDHYLPFIVLGRAEGWPLRKTLWWTLLCGLGHVLSSVVLGAVGVALGWAVSGMEQAEGLRGTLASWALIGFGLLYLLYGLWRAAKGGHSHAHLHADGTLHRHSHHHAEAPGPQHGQQRHEEQAHVAAHRRTVWTLFLIFVLGPCEPLIPLLMVPAAQHSWWGVAVVAAVFGLATVSTMMVMVTLGHFGLAALRMRALERYVHALAGGALLVSGLAVKLLGL